MNATGVNIGNGQLSIHLVLLLLSAFLTASDSGWKPVLTSSLLMLGAMTKPTVALPFYILFAVLHRRAALLTAAGYTVLTAFAMTFQQLDLIPLLQKMIERNAEVAAAGGYGNLHSWLGALNLSQLAMPLSFVFLAGLALWLFYNRKNNLWILLAVCALIARIWTYHRMYDDVLILFPMIALLRAALQFDLPNSRVAFVLLVFSVFLNLARLSNISELRYLLLTAAHQGCWIVMLAFFIRLAHRERIQVR